jgi:hypothetical protein
MLENNYSNLRIVFNPILFLDKDKFTKQNLNLDV